MSTREAILHFPSQFANLGAGDTITREFRYDVDGCLRRMEEFRARIQPWVDLKLGIVGISLPEITIGPNFYSATYPPEIKRILDRCDAEIENIARNMGVGP